jgi:tetratricopeptide (TPR) repeat protein
MKFQVNLLFTILMLLTLFSWSSCRNGPPNKDANVASPSPRSSVNTINGNGSNINGNPDGKKVDAEEIDNSVANADTAMIFKVDKDVSLKNKGAADFVSIVSGLFRNGDVLRVGAQALAWVTCPDGHVCPLGAGDYYDCCNVACAEPIQMRPPDGETRVMMRRIDLPSGERQKFETAELRIRKLGADEVTEQFLIANLYSSWKLTEANDEVEKLSVKLKNHEAQQKLGALYVPLVRKTGDLYFKIDQKVKAERSYTKAIEIAPAQSDEREKAAAHSSLGQLYETTGRKKAAVENLQKATTIYEKEGETQKATRVRSAMTKVQSP